MRLSNKRKSSRYNFINTCLLMMVVLGFLAFFIEKYKFKLFGTGSYLFIILPVFLLICFYKAGRQIFEYDSDGEAVHFRNRNIIPFIDKPLSDEFPKYKLYSYEIINFLFVKRLYIKITSKNTIGHTNLKYDITYLTKREINDLVFSLDKIVKANNEKSH